MLDTFSHIIEFLAKMMGNDYCASRDNSRN